MSDKKKIFILCDHPLVPSGVGTQARYLIEGLIKTGKYSFIVGGGAVRHANYTPQVVEPDKYGQDWRIIPVDGYGSKDFVRKVLASERPDALVIFTDPRFFVWLWEMEDEIRSVCPLIYWHVWDNDPSPDFNRPFYESTDHVAALSLKTYGLLQDLDYKRFSYIPHAVDENVFKPLPEHDVQTFKRSHYGPHADSKFVVFWNNRNARRKMTGDVLATFSKFSRKVGKENVALMLHTDPKDPEGQDVFALAKKLDIESRVMISKDKLPAENMNMLYNVADCTMNIACFPAGAKVTTADGYTRIEDISEGDLVLTHRGRMMPVVKTYSGRNSAPLYTIRTTNCDPVVSTEEHPFLVIKKSKIDFLVNENVGKLRELARWTKANEIEVGDYVVSAEEHVSAIESQDLDVWKHAKDVKFTLRDHEKHTYELVDGKIFHKTGGAAGNFAAKEKLLLDEDLAYIFGEWVADGSTNSCVVSFNKRDVARAEILRKKYESVFGSKAWIRESSRHNDVVLQNAAVYSKFFIEHCGAYSEGKRVPYAILRSSDSIKRAFLAGYQAGDGCVLTHPQYGNKVNRVRTISHNLACGVRSLLVSLGYCPSVKDEENSGSYKEGARIYTIEWRERKRENNGSCRSWNDGIGVISRVFDVEKTSNEDGTEVFNIEVAEDNSYTVSNISVHNSNEGFGLSTLESLFAGTPIIAHMTGGLQFQMGDWWEELKDFSDQDKLTEVARSKLSSARWWGAPIFSASRSITGSQQIPYINDDRVSHDFVVKGLLRMYEMGRGKRKELGMQASKWAREKFVLTKMISDWDSLLTDQVNKFVARTGPRVASL